MSNAQRYIVEALKRAGKLVITKTNGRIHRELVRQGWRTHHLDGEHVHLEYKGDADDTTT